MNILRHEVIFFIQINFLLRKFGFEIMVKYFFYYSTYIRVEKSSAGRYTCTVTNSAGNDYRSYLVAVHAPPSVEIEDSNEKK